MNINIYVATHKKAQTVLPKNYQYIQVNAQNNKKLYPLTDAEGDNISCKNPYYCELTATYWIWKNDSISDVVGLAHYRRFLTLNKFSSSQIYFINAKKIKSVLKKFDFIATKKYKTKITVKQHLLVSVKEVDFNILYNVIKNNYPEYLDAFNSVFNGHKSFLLNMFICKKELFNKYCEWLFSVFDKMEPQVDMTGYSEQQKRLYGYLGERLFTVYVLKNGYKVKSFSTCIVGESKLKLIKNKLQKMLFKKY